MREGEIMRMNYFAVIFILGLLPICSHADGNTLLEQCIRAEKAFDTEEIKDPFLIGMCMGLVQGVRNTMILMGKEGSMNACFPEGGIKNNQGVRIVTSYLKKNPESLHENEVLLTILAFIEAYPCK